MEGRREQVDPGVTQIPQKQDNVRLASLGQTASSLMPAGDSCMRRVGVVAFGRQQSRLTPPAASSPCDVVAVQQQKPVSEGPLLPEAGAMLST